MVSTLRERGAAVKEFKVMSCYLRPGKLGTRGSNASTEMPRSARIIGVTSDREDLYVTALWPRCAAKAVRWDFYVAVGGGTVPEAYAGGYVGTAKPWGYGGPDTARDAHVFVLDPDKR